MIHDAGTSSRPAIVLYTGHALGATELCDILQAAAAAPGVGALYVLHTGLDPYVVAVATRTCPGVRFLRANAEHYRQFGVKRSHFVRLMALDVLRLEGHERLVVAPAIPEAVPFLAPALRDSLVPDASDGPTWTGDVGRTENRILVVGGRLAGEDTLRRLDRALLAMLSGSTTPWQVLAEVRTHLVSTGALPDDDTTRLVAAPVPVAPSKPEPEPELATEEGDAADEAAAASAGTERTASDLLDDARAHMADGDFVTARELLLDAAQRPGGLSERHVLALAQVLRARSEYDAARNVLHLLHGDLLSLSKAAAEEADIAWVQHDYAAGEHLALYALRANPVNRKAEIVRDRCRQPFTVRENLPARGDDGPLLSHVAFYVSTRGNFGDVVLPHAVRESVTSVVRPSGWFPVHAHQLFDGERLELVQETDGVVVGGGGLFLPDTAPNGNSGWQWNIPREHLEKLTIPLGVVGVGFNLFPGQAFKGSLFRDNLEALVDRADLVGLRNHGSVRQVRDLLPPRLADKVTFLPCPTTVLSHVHERGPATPRGVDGAVLINAAFDRSSRRFGEGYGPFLAQMAGYVRALRDAGAEVRCVAHLPADERIANDLAAEHGIRLRVDALYDMSLEDAYELYRRAGVVVGMRGHATMIPFGLGTPVLSLISHPKMRYFLEDIDRLEWGFEVSDPEIAGAMTERTLDILARQDHYRGDIAGIQLMLLEIIQRQVAGFCGALSPQAAGEAAMAH